MGLTCETASSPNNPPTQPGDKPYVWAFTAQEQGDIHRLLGDKLYALAQRLADDAQWPAVCITVRADNRRQSAAGLNGAQQHIGMWACAAWDYREHAAILLRLALEYALAAEVINFEMCPTGSFNSALRIVIGHVRHGLPADAATVAAAWDTLEHTLAPPGANRAAATTLPPLPAAPLDDRPPIGSDHSALLAWFKDAQLCACSGCSATAGLRVRAHTITWGAAGQQVPTVIARCSACGHHSTFLSTGDGYHIRRPSFGAAR